MRLLSKKEEPQVL